MSALSRTVAVTTRTLLVEAARSDASVTLVGDALGRADDAVLRTLPADQRRETPVGDRSAAGLALGLALGGRRPVLALTHAAALTAALPTLQRASAISADGTWPCPLVVRVPVGGEAGPVLDASIGALLPALAGVRVWCARDTASAAYLLGQALQSTGPVVLLEPRALADEAGAVAEIAPQTGATVVHAGPAHVTLAAWGAGVRVALNAAQQLAADGILAEVLDLVSLAPLDHAALGRSVQATGRLVVVTDDAPLADAVQQAAIHAAFLYLESPLGRAAVDVQAIVQAAADAVRW